MTDWSQPQEIADTLAAFPADIGHLMPTMEEIPAEFHRSSHPWCLWQAHWFFRGLESFPKAKEGIDQGKAMRHLSTIQRSYQPKHEHKEAAVAYLASLWLGEAP